MLGGVLKSVPALPRDDSICTFPQTKKKVTTKTAIFFCYFNVTQSCVLV